VKSIKKSATILSLLFFSVSFSYGIELSFKFSGGLNYLNLNNINRSLQDWAGWYEKKGAADKNWSFEGEVKKFHSGLEFEGEIMLTLSSHFAVSLGSGLIYGKIADKKTEITVEKKKGTFIYVRPNKVSASPLNLAGYFILPIKGKIRSYLKGGIGWYWAKYIDWQGERELTETEFNFSSQIASAKGPAFEGGLGISVEINPYLQLFIEGIARKAKISGFQGEIKKGEKGTLFYFEEYDSNLDFWQGKVEILSEKPDGEEFRSIQEAVVDFSGFSVKIGVIIKF